MWINYLPYVVDAISLCILIAFFSSGCKSGFASKVLRAVSALLAIVITYYFYTKLAQWMIQVGIEEAIALRIKLPTNEIAELPVPSFIKYVLEEQNNERVYEILRVSSMTEYIRYRLARILVNGISILLVFVISMILLRWLSEKLKFVNKIPLIGMVNALLGGAMSLIVGTVLLMFGLFLLTSMSAGWEHGSLISDAIERSYITTLFQRINWFNEWILRITY